MRRTWHDKPWLRVALIAVMGSGLFFLGTLYIGLGAPPDVISYRVFGGEQAKPGAMAAFRVQARYVDAKRTLPVALGAVTIGPTHARVEAEGGNPAVVIVKVPRASSRAPVVKFEVSVDDQDRQIQFPFRVNSEARVPPVVERRPLYNTKLPFRVDVIPEGNGLALGMTSRCFLFVRDRTGAPLAHVGVVVAHRSFPSGRVTGITDAAGLMSFKVKAMQPSFRFKVRATQGEKTMEQVAYVRPIGRRVQLNTAKPVVTRGAKIHAQVRTFDPETRLYCDVRSGGDWVWTGVVYTDRHQGELTISPLEPGAYTLQCYDHPLEPGLAFATQPFIVTHRDARDVLRERVMEAKAWPAVSVAPANTESALLASFWANSLRPDAVAPKLLLSTRKEDLHKREMAHDREKGKLLLLMGLALLVVIAWAADSVLRHLIRGRRRMRTFVNDEIDLEDNTNASAEARRLLNARGWLVAIIGIGGLVLNAVVIIWLLWMTNPS